jgi:hypothetical protein
MPHCNPQGWFSHGAPPTDELKSQASDDCPLAQAAVFTFHAARL